MKVCELIEELKKMPQDLEAVTQDHDGWGTLREVYEVDVNEMKNTLDANYKPFPPVVEIKSA
jgi:hypothetical protein